MYISTYIARKRPVRSVCTVTLGSKVSGSTYSEDYVLQADDEKVGAADECVVKEHRVRKDELLVRSEVISLRAPHDADVNTLTLNDLPSPSILCTTTDGKNPVYQLVGLGQSSVLSYTLFKKK